jgi:hypothetical protein
VEGRWNRPDKLEDSMKKLMLLTVAIASITTLSLSAADDAAPKKEKAKKELSAEVIKKYDKDGDGKLSKEEMQAYRADQKKDKPAKQ